MREIKFRAWDRDQNIMFDNVQSRPGFLFRDFLNNERFVVEQFTGLKDKNSKKIYDEDIVKWVGKTWVIGFIDGRFGLRYDLDEDSIHDKDLGIQCFHKTVEIIGNIHENPGLLKD